MQLQLCESGQKGFRKRKKWTKSVMGQKKLKKWKVKAGENKEVSGYRCWLLSFS